MSRSEARSIAPLYLSSTILGVTQIIVHVPVRALSLCLSLVLAQTRTLVGMGMRRLQRLVAAMEVAPVTKREMVMACYRQAKGNFLNLLNSLDRLTPEDRCRGYRTGKAATRWKFSKVRKLLSGLCKMTLELTFEESYYGVLAKLSVCQYWVEVHTCVA